MTNEAPALKVVFMGTPGFALPSLDAIFRSQHHIKAVVTAPDKPAGRGRKMRPSAVKEYAVGKQLPLLQPEKMNDPAFINHLKELAPDVMVVVAFRMIPEVVWSIPPLGTFNLHASLLPQYRGAAPINHAVMNGETTSGLTTFFIDHKIDTGNIILQDSINIAPEETAGELHDRMMLTGADLVMETLRLIALKDVRPIPQDELVSAGFPLKTAPRIFPEHTQINWSKSIDTIYNQIRGLSPYPGAVFEMQHPDEGIKRMKVFRASIDHRPNDVVSPKLVSDHTEGLYVLLPDGILKLLEVQLEGRKRMSVDAFLRGFPIDSRWKLL